MKREAKTEAATDFKQPTPAELSHLSVTLAQANQTPITQENRGKLLSEAYDLWQQAHQIIQARQTARPLADADVVAGLCENTITFAELIEKKLLPKQVGKKGTVGYVTSVVGARNAFTNFYESVVDGKTRWNAFLFRDEPLNLVLRLGAMSKTISAAFVTWKRVQCELESPFEDRLAIEKREASRAKIDDSKKSPTTPPQGG